MSERVVVGVLGGTFDPVHLGHLAIAERVLQLLRMSRMLLVLTARPPHKQRVEAGADHREAMLRLAVADRPGLEVSALELATPGTSYTIDTLRGIRGGTPPADPVFVLGADSLLEIGSWREAKRLVEEFDLVAVDRPGRDLELLRERLAPFVRPRLVPLAVVRGVVPGLDRLRPGRGGRVFHLRDERIPISSSGVRRAAARGGDLTGLVPPAVAGYIRQQGLYRREARR